MTLSGDDRPAGPDLTPPPPGRASGVAYPARLSARWVAPVDTLRAALARNYWRVLLVGPAGAYLVLVGALLAQATGVVLAAALTAAIAVFGPRVTADTMLSLYRAEPVATGQAVGLRTAIEALSIRAGLAHEPALAIVPSLAIGAFSAGSGPRVALLMTEGLLRRMTLAEVVVIAAHEIGHIRNGDLPVFALADLLVRVAQALFYCGIGLVAIDLALWLAGEPKVGWLPIALLLLAPALDTQLQLALPRDADFAADRTAAHLLGESAGIGTVARALGGDEGAPLDDLRFPVPQRRSPLPSPLRFPPEPESRIAALHHNPPAVFLPPLAVPDEPMISLLGFGPIEMRPRNRWPGVWF